jgi:hypothetical protein
MYGTQDRTELDRREREIRAELTTARESGPPSWARKAVEDLSDLLDLIEHQRDNTRELEALINAEADLCKQRHGGLDPHDVILHKHELQQRASQS